MELSQTLTALSTAYPEIWSQTLQGKTNPITRICDLAKAGSQGASSEFWLNIARICRVIPDSALPKDRDEVLKLLSSVHTGVTRKDEPRTNNQAAWTCYISLCVRLTSQLDADEQKNVLRETVFPLIKQYLTPSPEAAKWNLPSTSASTIVASILQNSTMASVAESEWDEVTKNLLESVQTSAPEQAKDYAASQNSVADAGKRLFGLASQVVKGTVQPEFEEEIYRTTSQVFTGCLQSLESRQGKPYGAATVAEVIVRSFGSSFFAKPGLAQPLAAFVENKLPELIGSPSGSQLVLILMQTSGQPYFTPAWEKALAAILNSSDTPQKIQSLQQLVSSPNIPSTAKSDSNLQAYITRVAHRALSGEEDWNILGGLFGGQADVVSPKTSGDMLSEIMEALTIEETSLNAMSGLQLVVNRNRKLLEQSLQGEQGASLLQRLLLLTESSNEEIASVASQTSQSLQSSLAVDIEGIASTASVVQQGLYEADQSSLSVDTLVELARTHIGTAEAATEEKLAQVIPVSEKWSKLLETIFTNKPAETLAVITQLGGAVYLVDDGENVQQSSPISVDRDGLSAALRIAHFTVKLFKASDLFSILPAATRVNLCYYMSLTIQLANDNLSVFGVNPLWTTNDSVIEADMAEFISDAQAQLKSWLQDESTFTAITERLLQASTTTSPISYHNARAFSYIWSEHIELNGVNANPDMENKLRTLSRTKNSFEFAAYLQAYKASLSQTPAYTRICNELVASLTGYSLQKQGGEALRQLVHLNLMLQDEDHVVDTIAKQRLVFLVKHVVAWLHDESASLSVLTETCKVLAMLLPAMKDVYGEHWASVIDFLAGFLSGVPELTLENAGSAIVPLIHSSLRLLVMLQKLLRDEDSNDDVKDAWQESLPKLSSGLMHLLQQLGQVSDENNQTLSIVNELLGRQIRTMPIAKLENVLELYPLMTAESQHVQRIAFELLHKQIPAQQEEISINVVLEKTDAKLPDELLSLIIEPPTLDSLIDASFDRTIPLQLRSYLSSWLLVFDHFKKASDKLKNDYITHLKSGDYLSGLLLFTFDFLGHSRAKPLDPSTFAIEVYSFDLESSPVRDTQWLLCHLYYLCLKRLPALTKTWWMDCKSRQTVLAVESWTEKYLSQLIIADALATVTAWTATQTSLPPEEQLVVKPNPRAREISVAKEIDEQQLALVIRLPPTYPLGQATLHGISRVAVDEKKWRSWLLNSQGVIAFSNNSLVDGIVAFRRNVVGALKGQTECAICYSVVGPDKQLPTKRCGTCKQLFHGSCLFRWFKSSNSSSCPLCRKWIVIIPPRGSLLTYLLGNAFNYS